MPDRTIDKDELIRQLMADRDRLFRENSRLRVAINTDPESVKQDHKEQLEAKDIIIVITSYSIHYTKLYEEHRLT